MLRGDTTVAVAKKMRVFGHPCARVLYPNSCAKAAEWISRSRETWLLIFGVQRHYFVSAPATLPIDLLKGVGIIAMTEREQKQRVHQQESQQAQHVFSQID
jgi:hypothetical protein